MLYDVPGPTPDLPSVNGKAHAGRAGVAPSSVAGMLSAVGKVLFDEEQTKMEIHFDKDNASNGICSHWNAYHLKKVDAPRLLDANRVWLRSDLTLDLGADILEPKYLAGNRTIAGAALVRRCR